MFKGLKTLFELAKTKLQERYEQVLKKAEGSEEEFLTKLRRTGQELLVVGAFFGRVLRVHVRDVRVFGNTMMLKQKEERRRESKTIEKPKVGPELPGKCASHKGGPVVCQQMQSNLLC